MDSKIKRILLMYITKVSGHRQATIAIEDTLKSLNPDVEIMSINGFGYTYPILERVVNRAYMGVVRRTPKVWDYLYDNPKVFKRSQSIKEFLHKTSHSKLSKLMHKFNPDAVLCTQAFPCGMVADYKMAHNLKMKLIGVLTDYAPHSYWLNDGVDYYVVPSKDAKERFVKKGIPENRVKLFGIPIQPKFAAKLDKAKLAEKMNLDVKIPTILIMGGGQGLGPIKKVVKSLTKMKKDLQIFIIAGTNKKLIKWARKRALKFKKKILAYEYAKNVDELMELATLIITKPGGMTTTEALAKGVPMVIVDPLPGQEMRNTDFLLKSGIAIRIDRASDIGEEVEILLESPDRLRKMSKAAYDNARPYAALDIAKLVLDSKF